MNVEYICDVCGGRGASLLHPIHLRVDSAVMNTFKTVLSLMVCDYCAENMEVRLVVRMGNGITWMKDIKRAAQVKV